MLGFFSFIKRVKRVPEVEKVESHEMREFTHRNNRLTPKRVARIKSVILANTLEEKAWAIAPYVEDIAEDEGLMSLVHNYGHVENVFFMCCKKMSLEEYQHEILNYYLDKSVRRTNLAYCLFQQRVKDIKFSIWVRMVKDERFHSSLYHFLQKAKEEPEYWQRLVIFFQVNKFDTVPCPSALDTYVAMQKELFEH
ncbi:MAG: hypothetical protein PHE89_01165 [Alphaproteobacteria bacterium]|nr:hypothetical protein [Alphaproteobacteria bacterium]